MSNRQIKKLLERSKTQDEEEEEQTVETFTMAPKKSKKKKNKSVADFEQDESVSEEIVNSTQQIFETENTDDYQEENQLDETDESVITKSTLPKQREKSKKIKGKSKKEETKSKKKTRKTDEDDDDFLEKEFQKLQTNNDGDDIEEESAEQETVQKAWDLLAISKEVLNPDNEFKKLFGSKVIQSEKKAYGNQLPRGHQPHHHHLIQNFTFFTKPKDHWPPHSSCLFSLQPISKSQNDLMTFSFDIVGDSNIQEYNTRQNQLKLCIESHDPQNIMNLSMKYPYDVPILLQLADIFLMQREYDQQQDFVERILYAYEIAMTSSKGSDFWRAASEGRVRFDSQDNDHFIANSYFITTLLHRLQGESRKGLHKTALEICKLLLQISALSGDDSIAHSLLLVDAMALRSRRHTFLLELIPAIPNLLSHRIKESTDSNSIFKFSKEDVEALVYLPNLMYAMALALFQEAQEQEEEEKAFEWMEKASVAIQDALFTWPMYFVSLINTGDLGASQEWTFKLKNTFFDTIICTDALLNQLIHSVVERHRSIWKDLANSMNPSASISIPFKSWLQEQVSEVIKQYKTDEVYQKRRESVYYSKCTKQWYSLVNSAELCGKMLPQIVSPFEVQTEEEQELDTNPTMESLQQNPLYLFLQTLMPWTSNNSNSRREAEQ